MFTKLQSINPYMEMFASQVPNGKMLVCLCVCAREYVCLLPSNKWCMCKLGKFLLYLLMQIIVKYLLWSQKCYPIKQKGCWKLLSWFRSVKCTEVKACHLVTCYVITVHGHDCLVNLHSILDYIQIYILLSIIVDLPAKIKLMLVHHKFNSI